MTARTVMAQLAAGKETPISDPWSLKTWVRHAVPTAAGRRLKTLRAAVLYAGRSRYCPCCGRWAGRFEDHGDPVRAGVQCPTCGSVERHRLLWRYLSNGVLRPAARVLHLAPEEAIAWPLKDRALARYVTSDLGALEVDVVADLTASPFADGSFDLVLCSHVLEHIPDDRAAMAELRRVVAAEGQVVVQVPLRFGSVTDEDPTVVDADERRRRFGQEDHVRFYGDDLTNRLDAVGFEVMIVHAFDAVGQTDIVVQALGDVEPLLVCRPVPRQGDAG